MDLPNSSCACRSFEPFKIQAWANELENLILFPITASVFVLKKNWNLLALNEFMWVGYNKELGAKS